VPIKWKKVSDYCIECDNVFISKYKVMDIEKFVLFHGIDIIKVYNTAKEAKDEAMAFIKSKPAKPSSIFDGLIKSTKEATYHDRGK